MSDEAGLVVFFLALAGVHPTVLMLTTQSIVREQGANRVCQQNHLAGEPEPVLGLEKVLIFFVGEVDQLADTLLIVWTGGCEDGDTADRESVVGREAGPAVWTETAEDGQRPITNTGTRDTLHDQPPHEALVVLTHDGLESSSHCCYVRLPDRRLRVAVQDAASVDHEDKY